MRAQDEGDASLAEETAAALAFFDKESLRAIGRGFYAGDPTRDRVAAYAPTAMRSSLLRERAYAGADRLAALACAAVKRGFAPEIALAGGVFDDSGVSRTRARCGARAHPERARRGGALLAGRRRAAAGLSRAWPRRHGVAGMSLLDTLRGGLIVSVQAWRVRRSTIPPSSRDGTIRARGRRRRRARRGRGGPARRASARARYRSWASSSASMPASSRTSRRGWPRFARLSRLVPRSWPSMQPARPRPDGSTVADGD